MKLLIRGGHVVDPAQGLDGEADVLIEGGVIARVAPRIAPGEADQVLDAAGLVVVPGLVDGRAHLGTPGWSHREELAVGARAALRGGFTTVVAYPDGDPPLDGAEALRGFLSRAAAEAECRVVAAGALTVGCQGRLLTEAAALRDAGAVALTDARPLDDGGLLRRALRYGNMCGLPVAITLGEPSLDAGGVLNEGTVSARLGLPGIPAVAESVALARSLLIAEDTGCTVHVGPVTTAGAVELLRWARSRGVPVTAETTYHHVALTEEAVLGFVPHTKVWPPLRTEADRQAVIRALADGVIDCLVSDHTPYSLHETDVEWAAAPFGIVGFETAVALSVTHLIATGSLSWSQWVERVALAPARVFGLEGGTLLPGRPADVTIIDPEARWTPDPDTAVTRGRNSPFYGVPLQGRVVQTIVGGRKSLP